MEQLYDINIKIDFTSLKYYQANVIEKIIHLVGASIFDSEIDDLNTIAMRFPELPTVVIDAAKHRINKYKGSALLLEYSERGSIILGGVAAGVAIFILQKTVGETLTEAWVNTNMHQRLKNFLLEDYTSKASRIVEAIKVRKRKGRWETHYGYNIEVSSSSVSDKANNTGPITIVIKLSPNREADLPPTRSESIGNRQNKKE